MNTNYGTEIKVADIKKRYIENIIESAPLCGSISEIVLFGSALEERCKEQSDIDIAVISKYTVNRLCKNKGFSRFLEQIYSLDDSQEYDRLYFYSINEIEKKKDETSICRELSQKGKVIYRRI
jgi:predicted nucleotidyltransferase